MNVIAVLAVTHRLAALDEVLASLLAQTHKHRLMIIAQRASVASYCSLNGLEFTTGTTGQCGDRINLAVRHPHDGYWLFIDDDMSLAPSFLEDNLSRANNNRAIGWWAFVLRGDKSNYFRRRRPAVERIADYSGLGGLLIHSNALKRIGECPEQWLDFDDIWLSSRCHALGIEIYRGRGRADFLSCHNSNSMMEQVGAQKQHVHECLLLPELRLSQKKRTT